VDGGTIGRLADLGLDAEALRADNDSYHARDACGGLVKTGPTGTNVNDLTIVLCR
jgi:hydroxypyruvate reductase